ncbi:hypothetical protein ACOI22_15000 [Glaciecola sp. 2405UD65-10]|uniref:hypothetical protein n=1 Tax=Glaciecola sp. 2405UD65-10 TaxID=3397244 RepID=UPI003B59B608
MRKTIILLLTLLTHGSILANSSDKARMLDKTDINNLSGGICQSAAVTDCGGSEELATRGPYKQWWIEYKPITVFSDYCLAYTDNHSVSDIEFSRDTTFEIGRVVAGSCVNLTPYRPPKSYQGISIDLVSFFMDKKDDIERKSKNAIEFSRCERIRKLKLVDVKVYATSIYFDDSKTPMYALSIFESASDELYQVYYTVNTHNEMCIQL